MLAYGVRVDFAGREFQNGRHRSTSFSAQGVKQISIIFRKKHLAPYLPTHPIVPPFGTTGPMAKSFGTVSAAPFGSSAILPISWAYIKLMGPEGMRHTSEIAILNANYMSKRLDGYYKTVFRNSAGKRSLLQ
jgi:glycine cleavage system protein P-like pyridoxal-binding family